MIEVDQQGSNDPLGNLLLAASTGIAIFGGGVLLIIVCINFLSILGRFLFSAPLVGDFELVEMGCAIAISSFLPLCQMTGGHVIVDFVTSKANRQTKSVLDGISTFIFGLVATFFTWRMFFGVQDMYHYNEETMLLQIPVWIPFLPVVFSFFLLALCCFYTTYTKIRMPFTTE